MFEIAKEAASNILTLLEFSDTLLSIQSLDRLVFDTRSAHLFSMYSDSTTNMKLIKSSHSWTLRFPINTRYMIVVEGVTI